MDKVIFLDIDGVLNHAKFFEARAKAAQSEVIDSKFKLPPHMWFAPDSVELLNKLVKETGAEVVVSSSWRFDSKLQEIFDTVGLKFKIAGRTPSFHYEKTRGDEIQVFIDKHDVKNYVILDDDDDMLETQLGHFVQTDANADGFNYRCYQKAVEILNKDTKKVYGVFFPYRASDIFGTPLSLGECEYPRELRKVCIYRNKQEQLDAFANTMCPASQTIDADNATDFTLKVEQMHKNFDDPAWIAINVDPYL